MSARASVPATWSIALPISFNKSNVSAFKASGLFSLMTAKRPTVCSSTGIIPSSIALHPTYRLRLNPSGAYPGNQLAFEHLAAGRQREGGQAQEIFRHIELGQP